MKRSTNIGWGNIKVGLLIVFGVGVMFWASLSGGGTSLFEQKKTFVCYFSNVGGMVKGAPVWLSGVEVGNVQSITFVNIDSAKQVKLVCRVKDEVWPLMNENTRVQIGTIGFLGDKYIEIIPGIGGTAPLAEGGEVAVKQAPDASAVFSAAEGALKQTGSVVDNLDSLLERMNRGEGTFGQLAKNDALYRELTAMLTNLTKLTASLNANQERLFSSIERTSKSLENVSTKLDKNMGTAGRLMNDPALYDNLNSSTQKLDSLLAKLNAPTGNVGLLVNDSAVYVETVNLLARLNSLVDDIQKNPRKYLKFSVF